MATSTVERIVAQAVPSPRQQVLATSSGGPKIGDLFECAQWKRSQLFPSPVEA